MKTLETLFCTLTTFLTKGRKQDKKKFCHNTWIEKKSESEIVVRLWNTEIITAFQNGDIKLNSGGFRTQTTKDRFNNKFNLNGFQIYQKNSIWHVSNGAFWDKTDSDKIVFGFEDNMIITASGQVKGALPVKAVKAQLKLKKEIKKYVKDFIAELFAGNIKKPAQGDCFDCYLVTEDEKTMGEISKSDHLTMHIKESYYVPSLLLQATKRFAISPIAQRTLQDIWNNNCRNSSSFDEVTKRQLESSLKRYMFSQLNLAS